jgi:hypothetical protein
MDDLSLVGVHDDGDHLLVAGPNGQRFRLRVDDALRAAVRRDRARLSQLQLESEGRLRPKEIQARIRAGETAEEVAQAAGLALVGGVEGEGGEAVLGRSPGVESGGLLPHPTPRVDDRDRGHRVSGAGVGRVQVTGLRRAVADAG